MKLEEFSQGDITEIVRLYDEEKKSVGSLSKQYGCSTKLIGRLLRFVGCDLRTCADQLRLSNQQRVDGMTQSILEEYKKGKSMSELIRTFHTTFSMLRKIFSENGVRIRGNGEQTALNFKLNPCAKEKLDELNSVICMICKKRFKHITRNHLSSHNISVASYKEMYPNEKLISDATHNLRLRTFESRFGKKIADEMKKNVSMTLIGRRHSEETKIKIGKGNTGKVRTPEMRKRESESRIGKTWEMLYGVEKADALKKQMSKTNKGRKHTEKTKRKIGNAHRGMKRPPGTGKKISKALSKKIVFTMCPTCGDVIEMKGPSALRILSNSSIGRFCSSECFYSFIKGRKLSEEEKAHFYKNWLNPAYVEAYRKGRDAKPNKLEMRFNLFLDEHFPGKFKYVGDFYCWIAGKNPDFIDFKNKKIIELFGDYWHKGEDPQFRINHYKKHGYDCLVLWEHECSGYDDIVNKIQRLYDG